MMVIPAIDIRQGKSVRLKQGEIDKEVIHSNDPVFIAKLWQAKGAERIHVVDLDGAFNGIRSNKEVIKNICSSVDVPIEVGGGIRSINDVDEIFNMGASYVILGTAIIYNPEMVKKAIKKYGSDKIIIAIDTKNGNVAVEGWKDVTSINILDIIPTLQNMGIKQILYTDVSRDGMLTGPDFFGIKQISLNNNIKLIASGGVRTINDILDLKKYKNVIAVIVGSALYTSEFKLEEAVKITRDKE
jgi:phosphoribosylformimino-5-aminoimidazole carboxamide ribotide isomerase